MNDLVRHLAIAARHTALACESLVPPGPRRHLVAIRREATELVTELFTEHPAPDTPRRHSRRITIEED